MYEYRRYGQRERTEFVIFFYYFFPFMFSIGGRQTLFTRCFFLFFFNGNIKITMFNVHAFQFSPANKWHNINKTIMRNMEQREIVIKFTFRLCLMQKLKSFIQNLNQWIVGFSHFHEIQYEYTLVCPLFWPVASTHFENISWITLNQITFKIFCSFFQCHFHERVDI